MMDWVKSNKVKVGFLAGTLILVIVVAIVFMWPFARSSKTAEVRAESAQAVLNDQEQQQVQEEVVVEDEQEVVQAEEEEVSDEVADMTEPEQDEAVQSDQEEALAEESATEQTQQYEDSDFNTIHFFKQGPLGYIDFRNLVIEPGDNALVKVEFPKHFDKLTLQRVVADDTLVSAIYYTPDGESYDLTELLNMSEGAENPDEPVCPVEDPMDILVLESRGVNCEVGEQLGQNIYSVYLGEVKEGSYLVIEVSDNPDLQVNNGSFVSLSPDTDPLTVDLEGNLIEHPTFIPEGWEPPSDQ